MENNKYTFWKLLDKNSIEIPIIQRDYAQGRSEESRIRNKFLDVLFETIRVPDKTINLDFVYGRIIDKKLIPLDGQQRLTTLFLLHWYLAVKDDKFDMLVIEKLQKFTYETRVSSREFCKALVVNTIDLTKEKISKEIEDKNWFFKSWKKDPTIKSMLNMLDAIHDRFNKDKLFDKLICVDNPPITFDFLLLDDFNLTDELYIKMNARGKPLTEFENFKANFARYLPVDDKVKLDNSWTDLFWKYKDSNNIIDDKFLNFFTNMTLSFYVEKHELEKGIKVDSINIFDIYEDVYSENENVVKIIQLLDRLSCEIHDDIKTHFEIFIGFKEGDTKNKTDSKISYWDRARFYAIALFLIKNGKLTEKNQEQFSKWKRVTFNLINNTLIQRPEDFVKAIESLKTLSEGMNNIHENLLKDNCRIDFYLQSQVEEEKIKAKLISDDSWNEVILDCEKHWYFDGQIGFILELSQDDKGQYSVEKFQNYAQKCQNIFDKELMDNDEYLLQRALLAKGDYLVEIGRNYTFCSSETALRTKNDNWRKVFNDTEKRGILKDLLDDGKDLQIIINEFNDPSDWRYGFIKYPEILKYCQQYQIRMTSEYAILLLTKEQLNGRHAEYYTYYLYLELKKLPNIQIKYKDQSSIELAKYISIDNDNVKITYDNFDDIWQYEKESNGDYEYFEDKNEIIKSISMAL